MDCCTVIARDHSAAMAAMFWPTYVAGIHKIQVTELGLPCRGFTTLLRVQG